MYKAYDVTFKIRAMEFVERESKESATCHFGVDDVHAHLNVHVGLLYHVQSFYKQI